MSDILANILQLQEEIRQLEQLTAQDEEDQPESGVFHKEIATDGDPNEHRSYSYTDASPASIPSGTVVVRGPNRVPGEEPWADHPRPAEEVNPLVRIDCANGANCLDENFCYGDYECAECESCVNNVCQDIDVFAVCQSSDKKPCSPTPSQRYDCLDPVWRWWDEYVYNYQTNEFDYHEPDGSQNWHLTCRINDDCGQGEVCDNRHFYCVPACITDAQCDPRSDQRAGDAQSGSFCVSGECVTPCEAPRFCTPGTEATDCEADEYCAERFGRVASDPEGIRSAYQCESGCRDTCESERDSTGKLWPVQCVDNNCVRACSADGDCIEVDGEGCVGGECQNIGTICLASSDCAAGEYCNGDGRCQRGCRDDNSCNEPCPQDQACVNACPADPSCTCEGDECGEDFAWLDDCPRDPNCVRQCGKDPACLARRIEGSTCIDGTCAKACTLPGDCPTGYGCVDGKCASATGAPETRTECRDVEICGQIYDESGEATGETGCYFEEQCTEITIYPPIESAIYDCACGDLCDQEGQCAPALCLTDTDCESCSYCGPDGVCIPGCDVDNPCPEGECCGPDSKCHLTCGVDSDCPDPEVCLTGGCCGLACVPIILCSASSGCPDGDFCENGICQPGCQADSDCGTGDVCRNNDCKQSCVADVECGDGSTCANGICVLTPDPPCQNDGDCGEGSICKVGNCSSGCRTDSNCEGNEVCRAGKCATPCTSYEECIALEAGNICDSGFCIEINYGEGGYDGCECFETCDDMGRCVKQSCTSSSQCDCGDCLANSYCGICAADTDCPGNMLCLDGECLFPCIPETACTSDADCPADGFYCDQRARACLSGCQSSSNCLPGETCKNNTCRASCTDGSNCEENESCISGACVVTGYTCLSDTDCPSNEGHCSAGFCQEDLRCSVNDDCPSGSVCNDGLCLRSSSCTSASQCKTGEFCVEGLCSTSAACVTSNNCDAGLVCHDNRCKSGTLCVADGQCNVDDFCDQGLCRPDNRCITDEMCPVGEICSQGFCISPGNKDVPPSIGCDDCSETCSSDFVCVKALINDCGSGGPCRSDYECPDGFCIDGECVECVKDPDCHAKYGDTELVCNEGFCDTPCYTGLSNGDCSAGLMLGDMCENCPDSCPGGASECKEGGLSCGVSEYRDLATGEIKFKNVPCITCYKGCSRNSDCGGSDYGCYAGECVLRGGQCDGDNDCDGTDYCKDFECTAPDDSCFAASDCQGSDICVDGSCRATSGGSITYVDGRNECPTGKVQKLGKCLLACNTPFLYCITSAGELGSESVPCPEDYTCDNTLNRCVRNGYFGDTDLMGCPTGTFCCEGGCVDYKPHFRECCGDEDCADGKVCVSPSASAVGIAVCRSPGWTGTISDVYVEAAQARKAEQAAAQGAYNSAQLSYNSAKAAYDQAVALPTGAEGRPQAIFDAENALEEAEEARDKAQDELNDFDGEWNEFAGQPSMPAGEATEEDTDEEYGEQQDSCEPKGLCCGDDGFCTECECGDGNPCEGDKCCDPELGKCVDHSAYPTTKYGAPGKCQFGPVYCEVLDCDGSSIDPNFAFDGPGYEWCEEVSRDSTKYNTTPHPFLEGVTVSTREVVTTTEVKCHAGGEASDSQITTLLEQYCECEEDRGECACDNGEEEINECGANGNCGLCQECVTRYVQTDSCCGQFYEVDGVQYSGVIQSTCEAIHEEGSAGYEKNCQCETDSDCTDCERCIGRPMSGGNIGFYCEAQCDDLCPCGGDTTDGKGCKNCLEKYGDCGVEITGEVSPGYVDETTGELVPAVTRCICQVDTESLCCEKYTFPIETCDAAGNCTYRASTVDDIKGRDGCVEKTKIDANGTKIIDQVEYCIDFEAGHCAQCITDAQCPGQSVCLDFHCVTQCGQEESHGGSGDLVDTYLPAHDCSCCTDQGECKSLNESWTESRSVGGADGDNAQCRPCQCTENGVDCKAYDACESCYKWVRADGSDTSQGDSQGLLREYVQLEEARTQADRLQIEQKIINYEIEKEDQEVKVPELRQLATNAQAKLSDAEARYSLIGCNPADASPSQDCIDIQSEINAATAQVNDANSRLQRELDVVDEYQGAINSLTERLNQTFTNGEWVRERQCECCIDGQCRPESDCTYGNCYVCIDNSDPERLELMRRYRAAVYNMVKATYNIWQLTCMGDVPEHYDEEMVPNDIADQIVGSNVFYFDFDSDSCVKYKCEDGIQTHQSMGNGLTNIRYYEYCSGSIIGCVLSGRTAADREEIKKNYKQGWKFKIDLTGAGIYFGNAYSGTDYEQDWVRMSWPETEVQETGCFYPNPNAHVRSHTLPTFTDVVYTHECCSKSRIYFECDPESVGNCQLKFTDYYEAGNPDVEIKRIERDIAALNQYLTQIGNFLQGDLLELENAKKEELADLLKFEQDLVNLYNQLVEDIGSKESSIESKENQLKNQERVISGNPDSEGNELSYYLYSKECEPYEDARSGLDCTTTQIVVTWTDKNCLETDLDKEQAIYDASLDERDRWLGERDAYEDDADVIRQSYFVAILNRDSTLEAAEGYNKELETLNREMTSLQQELADELPDTNEYVEIEIEIAAKQVEIDIKTDERDVAQDASTGYAEEASELGRELRKANEVVKDAQRELQATVEQLNNATNNLAKAREALGDGRDRYFELQSDLIQLNNELVSLNDQLESIGDDVTIDDVEGDIAQQIDAINQVLDGISEVRNDLLAEKQEVTNTINEKRIEVARLRDEDERPEKPEPSSRPGTDDTIRTADELREIYKEQQVTAEKEAEKSWWPR